MKAAMRKLGPVLILLALIVLSCFGLAQAAPATSSVCSNAELAIHAKGGLSSVIHTGPHVSATYQMQYCEKFTIYIHQQPTNFLQYSARYYLNRVMQLKIAINKK